MRVALIAPPFLSIPPTGYGGIERVVSALADGLVDHGHDVTLFAAPGSASTACVEAPLPTAPLLGDPSSVAEELFYVTSAYLKAESFDVVHDHTEKGPSLGAILARRTPVVHTLHGPWSSTSRRFYQMVQHRLELVAISHAQRAANPDLRYAGVVQNGIDLHRHPFNATKEDFLLFVGRISPDKRPEVAIEIARRAGRSLVMVVKRSEPAERGYWDQVIAPRLGPDIDVLEQPPHDVKIDVVGRARAVLFPIDWPEPFGLVMTEAMACGTPVIARPLGAAPEVVIDGVTGYLCTSIEKMVEAVDAAGTICPLDCRRHVERCFSAEAMVAGYEAVYGAAVEARQTPVSATASV